MSTSYQLSFHLRKSRSNKTLELHIYLRVSVDKKRSAMTITRKVDPRKWHSKSEKSAGKKSRCDRINNYISVTSKQDQEYSPGYYQKRKNPFPQKAFLMNLKV